MKNETMKTQIDFATSYKLLKRKSKKLAILLHGFAQTNDYLLEKLIDNIPDEYDILAPNGPFPIPKIRKDYIEKRYAWYFYDRHTNSYEIDYSFSSNLIKNLITELGYKSCSKTVIGYSQGGYLSPFVALELDNVESIIGLSCTYKWQYLPELLPFNIYSIHGTEDDIVDHNSSKEHFDIVSERTCKESKFISLKNEKHEITSSFIDEIVILL